MHFHFLPPELLVLLMGPIIPVVIVKLILPVIVFSFYQYHRNNIFQSNITYIFDRCHHSWVVVRSVKYECDCKGPNQWLYHWGVLLVEKWLNQAVLHHPPPTISSLLERNDNVIRCDAIPLFQPDWCTVWHGAINWRGRVPPVSNNCCWYIGKTTVIFHCSENYIYFNSFLLLYYKSMHYIS